MWITVALLVFHDADTWNRSFGLQTYTIHEYLLTRVAAEADERMRSHRFIIVFGVVDIEETSLCIDVTLTVHPVVAGSLSFKEMVAHETI